MASWHKPGQKVVRVGRPGGWSSLQRRRWFHVIWQPETGPAFDEIVTIDVVVSHADGVWFHFVEFFGTNIYPATFFRPIYPEIIDDLRRLDAPAPEWVTEDA